MTVDRSDAAELARGLLTALHDRGWTLAVAESLTGGALAAAIVDVPGASAVFRGGIVAYATPVKHSLVGVDADLLSTHGAVSAKTAAALAEGARKALAVDGAPADVALATTGVAGPDAQEGHAAGTVFVAVASSAGTVVEDLALTGSRSEIRAATVRAALRLGLSTL